MVFHTHDEISELRRKVEEFEQNYSEVESQLKGSVKEAEDSKLKVSELQETIDRLALNLSNIESENQVPRQQALIDSTKEDLYEEMQILRNKLITDLESENKKLRQEKIVVQQIVTPLVQEPTQSKILDNGHHKEESHQQPIKVIDKQISRELELPVPAILSKQKSLTYRQQENQDVLIKCLMEEKRFDKGRPVAACVGFDCLASNLGMLY